MNSTAKRKLGGEVIHRRKTFLKGVLIDVKIPRDKSQA